MAEGGDNGPDSLDNSLNGEFPMDKDDGLSSSGSENELQKKKRRTQTPSPNRSQTTPTVPASPPKFVTFDQLMSAADGVRNMTLAHEIAVDNNFKLEKLEPKSGIEKQVREVVHKAFWDAFQEKLREDPPDYTHSLVLIEDVKENLKAILLPQHVRLRAQIEEVLDIELLKQKMEEENFDIYYYSNYIINIMAKLCAPARDDQIARLRETNDVVPLFKGIFEVLDLMKMDMANFTIQQIRPHLQQQSVEYERKKFQEFLKTQEEHHVDGLLATKIWLNRNFNKLAEERGDSEEGATPDTMITPAAILNEAYMELLQWDESQAFAETLLMDQGRFLDQCNQIQRLTLISSILLLTYNTVGSAISGVQSLKGKMKSEICTILEGVPNKDLINVMPNVAEQVKKSVNEFLKGHGFTEQTEVQQKVLVGQITELATMDHAVFRLLLQRVLSFIRQTIFSRHTEPIKVPVGLSAVEQELSQVCGQFLRLISHNRSVFGAHYSDIINVLLQRKMEDLSPR